MSTNKTAIVSTFIHSLSLNELEILEFSAIIFISDGLIVDFVDLTDLFDKNDNFNDITHYLQVNYNVDKVINYSNKFIIPGFIDAHCHAPQYVFSGTGMDLPLLEWLEKYTFPCEARFKDPEYAQVAYEKFVKRQLRNGTTLSSYFGTIYPLTTYNLAEIVESTGQRAFIGKVSMDRNSPDYYIEETSNGLIDCESFIREILSMTSTGTSFLQLVDNQSDDKTDSEVMSLFPDADSKYTLLNKPDCPLVMPCVTPRFVPTCSSDMMHKLGQLSIKYGLPVQSHLSESINEIEWVGELHPDCVLYGEVYDKHGLLHNGSYMAHCCHSSKEERALLRDKGCGVVHCPSSNFMLGSGIMDVRMFLQEGLKVALGTDVAGGYSPNMLDAIRQSIVASSAKSISRKESSSQIDNYSEKRIKNSISQSTIQTDRLENKMENLTINRSKLRSCSDMSLSLLDNEIDDTATSQATSLSTYQNNYLSNELSNESKMLTSENLSVYEPLNYKEIFYLATLGGAQVLSMDKVVGNFQIGKKLDCVVVDTDNTEGPIDLFGHENTLDKFQKFLFIGDDRNIAHVYVNGKIVSQ